MSVTLEMVVASPAEDDVSIRAGEYVQLRNSGSDDVDLSGWHVVDAVGHKLPLPERTYIPAGGVLRLFPGSGASEPGKVFRGRRAAVINDGVESLQLKNAAGQVVSALGSGVGDFAFDYEIGWPSQLKLIFSGTDETGFGLTTWSASIRLVAPGGPAHQVPGKIESNSLITASLPTDMVIGWYDTELTVRDIAGGERRAVRYRLPFGPDAPWGADLVIVPDRDANGVELPPRDPPSWSFGEPIKLKISKPVGTQLPPNTILQPYLRPNDGGARIGGFGPSTVGVDTITLKLPPEPWSGYKEANPWHHVSPGEELSYIDPAGIKQTLLTVAESAVRDIQILPVPLKAEDVEALISDIFTVVPATPLLLPNEKPQVKISARPSDEITGIAGLSDRVLSLLKSIVYESGATVQFECSLTVNAPSSDETGLPVQSRTATPTVQISNDLSPQQIVKVPYVSTFGLLRPQVVRDTGLPPTERAAEPDGFAATVGVKATIKGLPAPLPPDVEGNVRAKATITQLPLPIPSLAMFWDLKYDQEVPKGNRILVLLDGMPHLVGGKVLSTKDDSETTRKCLTLLAAALNLVRNAVPSLGSTFPGFPGASTLPASGLKDRTGLDFVADWLEEGSVEVTMAGFDSHHDIGAKEFADLWWWDAPEAAFLVGLQAGTLSTRTLRAYSDPNPRTASTPYLDMRVPVGHLTASLWTLHQTLFRWITPRAPFTTITAPDPWAQWRDAEYRQDRGNMPWFAPGASFGNVINAYEWIQTRPFTWLSSFRSVNFPDFYLRHRNFLGELTKVSTDLDKRDASFRIVPGLADPGKVSFEAINFPGYYLRHQGFRLKLQRLSNDELFRNDATFVMVPGLADASKVSFRSVNYPRHYIRHRGFSVYLEAGSDSLFRADSTFESVAPRSP